MSFGVCELYADDRERTACIVHIGNGLWIGEIPVGYTQTDAGSNSLADKFVDHCRNVARGCVNCRFALSRANTKIELDVRRIHPWGEIREDGRAILVVDNVRCFVQSRNECGLVDVNCARMRIELFPSPRDSAASGHVS